MAAGSLAAAPAAVAQTIVGCSAANLVTQITAANSAGSGTLILSSNCNYDYSTANGSGTRGDDALPVITANHLTIIGGRSTRIRRTGTTDLFRIFEVAPGARLNLESFFIEGGDAGTHPGGGILNARGIVTLTHVTVDSNSADNGAGIANDSGDVTLDRTLVELNQTHGGGGGGIYTDGDLAVLASRVTTNTAVGSGGGIFVDQGGDARLTQSTLDHNTTGISGGGLYNGTGGISRLSRTLVTRNTAPAGAGGGIFDVAGAGLVTLSGSVVTANTGGNCAPPGAVAGCTG